MTAQPAILAASYTPGGIPCAVSTAIDNKQAARNIACQMNMLFCPLGSGAGAHRMARAKNSRMNTSSTRMLIVAPRGKATSGNPSANA